MDPEWYDVIPVAVYEFSNVGEAPLRMQFGWTCATKNGSPRGLTLEPGATTHVEVPFYPHQGQNAGSVRTNDRAYPEVRLVAHHHTLRAVRMDDRVDFGKLTRDAGPQTRTLTIERGDGGPLDLKLLRIEPPRGNAKDAKPPNAEAELRTVEPGERYALDITIQPPYPSGWLIGRVRFATGVPEQPMDEVQFRASLAP